MRINAPKFEASRYFEARPFYPEAVFESLINLLKKRPALESFLDIGCGAGQSLASFLKNFPASLGSGAMLSGFAADPDASMIARTNAEYGSVFPNVKFLQATAEKISLEDSIIDLILVGSAFHWFDRELASKEFHRILKPRGLVFIFEYQFPKSLASTELNASVKTRFNREWKAPNQKPRGTLGELTQPFRDPTLWKTHSDARPKWEEDLSLESFLGHLFTQSRFLHAEAKSGNPSVYREESRQFFRPYFLGDRHPFDLKPRTCLFEKISPSRKKWI